MTFADFKDNPQGLIGKLVVYTLHTKQTTAKIIKVLKTGFVIDKAPNSLFSPDNGVVKGNSWHNIHCRIITDEQALEYQKKWDAEALEKSLRERMYNKVKTMTYDQLKQMEQL